MYAVLARRLGVPAHSLLGYELVPAWIAEDEMMMIEAEANAAPAGATRPTQDLLAGER